MDRSSVKQNPKTFALIRRSLLAMSAILCIFCMGCYAPMHSPGIAARTLPDEFRWPIRTSAAPLNYSQLVGQAPSIYLLGTGDKLLITAPDLIAQGQSEPFEVQVLDHGEIYLPRLGPVVVGGMSIAQAQQQINQALASGLLTNPNTVMTLKEKGTVNVLVLGAVKQPGVHALPRDENDVAHALAAAQGFSEDAGDVIEIHRRSMALPSQVLNAATQPGPQLQGLANAPATASGRTGPPLYQASAGHQLSAPQTNFQPPQQTSLAPSTFSPALQNGGGMQPGGVPATSESVGGNQQDPTFQLTGYRNSASRYSLPTTPISPLQSSLPPGQGHSGYADSTMIGGHSLGSFDGSGEFNGGICQPPPILRIPLRGENGMTNPRDVILNPGDVLVIPQETAKVFYVVGPLSQRNSIRFSTNNKDREIGGGLLLPDDREIDVVTAVAMAGYIDPIESPTTVTVHRLLPDRSPLLIRVDLLAARCDPQETVMVQSGDIIYLNPDLWWYSRRTWDRIIDRALGTAIGRWLTN